MYYDEKLIDGILHYKTDPKKEWTPYTLKDLSARHVTLQKSERALLARLADIKQKVADV